MTDILSGTAKSSRLSAVCGGAGKRIRPIASLLVSEEVEVSRAGSAGHVLAGHADEGAGEIRRPRRSRFVGENAGIELLRQPSPVVVEAVNPVAKVQPLVINFHPEMDRFVGGNCDGR